MPGVDKPEEPRQSNGASDTADSATTSTSAMDMLRGFDMQKILNEARPFMEKLEPYLRAAYPHVVIVKDAAMRGYWIVQPYWDEDVSKIMFSMVLLFFGGNFALSIACWQVFQDTGQRLVVKSWNELRESFREALTNLKKDREAREIFGSDNDGNIAVIQIFSALKDMAVAKTDQEKRVARAKASLIMKCIDPSKLWDASLGLWTGLVAILATLRSRFVYAITTGADVGKKAVDIGAPYVQPKLYQVFPAHQKWVDFALKASGGMIGAFTALLLIRVISAFNFALKGGAILIESLVKLNDRKKVVPNFDLNDKTEKLVSFAVAFVGFMFQLKLGFSLPWWLRLPLTPLLFIEWILSVLAARPF